MENAANYQFKIDGKQVIIQRVFPGSVAQVWRAFTDPQILDQWWAPKPWKCQTKRQDFRPEGQWLYAMQGPENEEHWATFTYDRIEAQQRFSGSDAFTDSEGNILEGLPESYWETTLEEHELGTLVINRCQYDSEETLKQYLEMGFKEGYELAQQQLMDLLKQEKTNSDRY